MKMQTNHTSMVLLFYDITVVSQLLKRSHHTVRAESCITCVITKWRGMKTGKKRNIPPISCGRQRKENNSRAYTVPTVHVRVHHKVLGPVAF